ncbi:MAG TPA: nucleotide exchange factor GrpE [Candidatus Acidoferrum sp.]|nr:nucleotide exchange factor GrpE [Candidatus Acidoferrum sp.]
MNDTTNWQIPKWPFLVGGVLLLVFGFVIVNHSPLPGHWAFLATGCVVLGAALSVIPYLLDYRAMGKALEVNALGAIADKIQNLEKLAAQISSATNHWTAAEESIRGQAEKTTVAAKAIADRMTNEVIEFSDFMKKMNDTEKASLKLEVEKLRRGEVEWLQVLVTILDHVYALHTAAARSGDAKFTTPVTNFQNACRDVSRRLGLVPFVVAAGEPFNAEHQKAVDGQVPAAGAVVAETVGCGYTFQGQPLRPALVRLRDAAAPAKPHGEKAPAASSAPVKKAAEKPSDKPVEKTAAPAPAEAGDEFALESPG